MKKHVKTTLGLFVLFFSLSFSVKATHIAGGEITYTCLGNNQYKIYLNLFVDCAGFNPGSTQTVNFTSTCGGSASAQVQATPATINGLEISQLCAPQLPQSTCNGGTLPGMWVFRYEGIVTLAPPCDTWSMNWSTCCRNNAITNISTSSINYFIEATLNSATAPCNSSPQFNAQPIPYVCSGQPVNYSYGVTELDGDSLHYQLIPALDAAGTPSTYNTGYSGTSPIPGITINPLTGLVTFTPITLGNFVVVIKVTEYDRATKKVLGTVMRDIQFVVMNCTNIVPTPNAGTIASLAGNALQTGPYDLEMCAGDSFNFTATFTDANATNVLTYTTNILTALPGAIITPVGTSTNPLTLNISWTAPPGSQGTNPTFTLTVSDGACPIIGQQTFVYYINILHATIVGSDITICGTQTAPLQATGGTIFNWAVVSGDPITPTNFSCNPCSNPVASPSVTTTYYVTSNLSGTCKNKDTITVNVVPDFSFNISQAATSSCLFKPIQFDVVNILPATAGYTFLWTPATNLTNANIQNPVATFSTPGVYQYILTVTNPFGCVKYDTLRVTVVPTVSPTITAYSDTTFCSGGTATLGLNFTNNTSPACGLSLTGGCNGTGTPKIVGTGTATNSSSVYPAPYGNFYKNARHQFLLTATELIAAGVTPGKIDRLDFNVSVITGTTLYKDYTISMGCTAINSLTTWQTGLSQVYNPKNFTISTGWNSHTFDNAFLWDGLSNIVIEICFNNLSDPSFTNNSSSPYTVTTFLSCLYFRSDSNPACGTNSNAPTTSNNRPNMRLHNCTIIANPANYSYSWTPLSGNIANPLQQNTTGQPGISSTTYTVTVTDIAGGCTASDTVRVNVTYITTVAVTPVNPLCVNANPVTLVTTAPAGFGTWTGNGITNATNGTFSPSVAGAGTHQIIYTINGPCGNAADTITIVVIPLLDATIAVVPKQCISDPAITLTAATSGGIWTGNGITSPNGTFNPGTAGVGTHTITYTINTPCVSVDTIRIIVVPQANAAIDAAGPFCTAAAPVILNAANAGGIWSGTGITNAAGGVFDPALAGAGNHIISYTIAGLCGAVDTTIIRVLASPVISLSSNKIEGCEPSLIVFTSTTDQAGGTCFWDFGDGNTSTNCNPNNMYTTAGNYTVTFTYSNTIGCSSTITRTNFITIHSQPVAGYYASPQPTTIVNSLVEFTDASTGVIDTWNWNFGSLGTSNVPNPYIVYPDTGLYPFLLIVSNVHGCADTLEGTIGIDPIATFYAPNAFTPNGNGNNDAFMVYADGINRNTFEMQIYNRWGELIFKSNNIYVGWNGKKGNTGTLVESDVYVWKVRFLDFTGKENNHIGHVTLLR